MIDAAEFGKAMGAIVRDAIAPLQRRIDELEARQPASVDLSDVVKELLSTEELGTLVDLNVASAVTKYFEDNPVPRGEVGPQGENGADGVGLAGALINREHELVITTTKGESVNLGRVAGADGAPGRDGADFTDVTFEYDGERTLTITGTAGQIEKRLPLPIYRGYWREGMLSEKSDIVTEGGNAWFALKETKKKPGLDCPDDWQLFTRKGRDGAQGPAGTPYKPPGPVQLS